MPNRPVRDRIEKRVNGFEGGPLGVMGGGDVAGAGGYLAVESVRTLVDLIPGLRKPGYTVNGHSTRFIEGGERHTFLITAASREVAEFVAQYYSAASNIEFVRSDTEIVSTEVRAERKTYSTYEIVVDVTE